MAGGRRGSYKTGRRPPPTGPQRCMSPAGSSRVPQPNAVEARPQRGAGASGGERFQKQEHPRAGAATCRKFQQGERQGREPPAARASKGEAESAQSEDSKEAGADRRRRERKQLPDRQESTAERPPERPDPHRFVRTGGTTETGSISPWKHPRAGSWGRWGLNRKEPPWRRGHSCPKEALGPPSTPSKPEKDRAGVSRSDDIPKQKPP